MDSSWEARSAPSLDLGKSLSEHLAREHTCTVVEVGRRIVRADVVEALIDDVPSVRIGDHVVKRDAGRAITHQDRPVVRRIPTEAWERGIVDVHPPTPPNRDAAKISAPTSRFQ